MPPLTYHHLVYRCHLWCTDATSDFIITYHPADSHWGPRGPPQCHTPECPMPAIWGPVWPDTLLLPLLPPPSATASATAADMAYTCIDQGWCPAAPIMDPYSRTLSVT
jgi:hypothetical protein